jgi:hypothetical protein
MMETPNTQADFSIENHGTIFLFRLNTPAAAEWVSQHVQEDAQFFGDALVVEHRYARDLAAALAAHGLVLA